MPEGPEIRRAADQLRRVLAGRQSVEVRFADERFPHLQRIGARLTGRTIAAVEPRGKAMLTHFDSGLSIYSHNQLYGEWAIYRGTPPPSHLQTRLTIRTATHSAILYSASEIAVVKTADLPRHPYIARLGVELLDPATTLPLVCTQVDAVRFARRNLAALLLDQGFLAGIGNYLRSDILFVAKLHPSVRLGELKAAQRASLARAALTLTRQSYRIHGVTNAPSLVRRLKAAGWTYAQYRHRVFDREGQPCHTCGTTIRRLEAAGRNLFLCDHCQS